MGPLPSRSLRRAVLAVLAGWLALAVPEARAAGVTVPSTVRLPSVTRKSSRYRFHGGRHHRPRLRDCPTKRGGDNDQNNNGRDDRCDTGPD
jgi:hypothetical protein